MEALCQPLRMARPKLPLMLSDEQKSELQQLVRTPSTSQQTVLRARIVLKAALGLDNDEIAKELAISRPPVIKWRQRFLDQGLPGLEDAAGRGRKSWLPTEKIRRVLSDAVRPRPGHARWSCRSMARQVGVSAATVQRLWSKNELKPHLTRTFKLSNDRNFEQKFWDVIGVYLNPPTQAVVLCCDEKSQCQAL